MRKGIINALTGIIVGSFFMYLTFRNKPVDEIFSLLFTARIGWIFLSLAMLILVFFLRAERWRLLLQNSGEGAARKDVWYSLLLGFFINSFTPKIGEIVRCTSLQKATGIPATRSFGTVISERIYDLIALIAGILIILVFESDRLGPLIGNYFLGIFSSLSGNLRLIIIIAIVTALVISAGVIILKKSGLRERARITWRGIMSGLRMTFRIKSSRIFILQTIAIWAVMVFMNYCCLRALPSTDNLSLYFAMVALFIGTIGWAIPSPGGMGTSHFFILQLFILFNLKESTGIAYGVLVNGLTVLFTIIAGLLAIMAVNLTRIISKYSFNTRKV